MDLLNMNSHRTRFLGLLTGLLNLVCASAMAAGSGDRGAHGSLGHDDDTFVFMGRCPNGEVYRLFSYDKDVDGIKQSFYDYQGPVGQGTVKTKTAPRVVMSRVCLAQAEIAGDE